MHNTCENRLTPMSFFASRISILYLTLNSNSTSFPRSRSSMLTSPYSMTATGGKILPAFSGFSRVSNISILSSILERYLTALGRDSDSDAANWLVGTPLTRSTRKKRDVNIQSSGSSS